MQASEQVRQQENLLKDWFHNCDLQVRQQKNLKYKVSKHICNLRGQSGNRKTPESASPIIGIFQPKPATRNLEMKGLQSQYRFGLEQVVRVRLYVNIYITYRDRDRERESERDGGVCVYLFITYRE